MRPCFKVMPHHAIFNVLCNNLRAIDLTVAVTFRLSCNKRKDKSVEINLCRKMKYNILRAPIYNVKRDILVVSDCI